MSPQQGEPDFAPYGRALFAQADARIAELEQALAHERGLREAAEQKLVEERLAYVEYNRQDYSQRMALTAYATRLLATLTQQRQALKKIGKENVSRDPYLVEIARAALATDTAALLAEGESLGVTP